MVFHCQPQGLDERPEVGPCGDGFGDLVEVAEEDEVLTVAILPEVGAVHEMFHGAVGFCAAAEQLESVIKVARDTMGELVALVGGQVVPTREVGAREFSRELGAGFVGFDRAKQRFVIGDAIGAVKVLKRADFLDAASFEIEGLEQEFLMRSRSSQTSVSLWVNMRTCKPSSGIFCPSRV